MDRMKRLTKTVGPLILVVLIMAILRRDVFSNPFALYLSAIGVAILAVVYLGVTYFISRKKGGKQLD